MGEKNPSYRPHALDALRASTLRPQEVRAVLWFASYRIMGDKTFNESDRKQTGVYLETIFKAADDIERQDAEFAGTERRPVKTLLDMGHMMAWAYANVRAATFPDGFNPARRGHRDANVHMRLNLGLTEAHLGDAYQKYVEYQEVRVRDAAWLSLRWF